MKIAGFAGILRAVNGCGRMLVEAVADSIARGGC